MASELLSAEQSRPGEAARRAVVPGDLVVRVPRYPRCSGDFTDPIGSLSDSMKPIHSQLAD